MYGTILLFPFFEKFNLFNWIVWREFFLDDRSCGKFENKTDLRVFVRRWERVWMEKLKFSVQGCSKAMLMMEILWNSGFFTLPSRYRLFLSSLEASTLFQCHILIQTPWYFPLKDRIKLQPQNHEISSLNSAFEKPTNRFACKRNKGNICDCFSNSFSFRFHPTLKENFLKFKFKNAENHQKKVFQLVFV